MIPWPYALACVLCAVAWLLWRQRLERRALHAQLDRLNAALRQFPLLGGMPDSFEQDEVMRAQQKAYETDIRRHQAAYRREQQDKMP